MPLSTSALEGAGFLKTTTVTVLTAPLSEVTVTVKVVAPVLRGTTPLLFSPATAVATATAPLTLTFALVSVGCTRSLADDQAVACVGTSYKYTVSVVPYAPVSTVLGVSAWAPSATASRSMVLTLLPSMVTVIV